jgi:hypothetical protein
VGGRLAAIAVLLVIAGSAASASAPPAPALKPLRVLSSNPRYFSDGSGRAVYLTGSHTWTNLTDRGRSFPPPAFAYSRYLKLLKAHRHNFIRLWTWELPRFDSENEARYVTPLPWRRTGPGSAGDGYPKFDLSILDPAYFDRLRNRVELANRNGIYVAVMLFEGWGVQAARPPWNWASHPFNAANNVNGVDGDVNGDGWGYEVHSLQNPEVNAIHQAYIRKVVDTVGSLPNVLFEIANEAAPSSTAWQYAMIEYLRGELGARGLRRPIGMTHQFGSGSGDDLAASPADWIAPGRESYIWNPPPADGRKVAFSDTDHHCGICGDRAFVWKNFTRGYNVIFMDPDPLRADAAHNRVRLAMGDTARFAKRIGLAHMTPRADLTSTEFALARGGREYLVYHPEGGRFSVDLGRVRRRFNVEWFDPELRKTHRKGSFRGRGRWAFNAPFGGDAVLYLKAR